MIKQSSQDRTLRLNVKQKSQSPIDRAPSKTGLNPFDLLNPCDSDHDSDSEDSKTQLSSASATLVKAASEPFIQAQFDTTSESHARVMHVDIEDDTEGYITIGISPTLIMAKSPPPRPASTSAIGIKFLKPLAPKKSLTPTAVRHAAPTPSTNSIRKTTQSEIFCRKLIAFIDTNITADRPVSASEHLKQEIADKLAILYKVSTLTAINTKLQFLLSLKNPEQIKNVLRACADSGLLMKLFPGTENNEENLGDLTACALMVIKDDYDLRGHSLLKAFYDKYLMMTDCNIDHSEKINQTPILREFYYIFSSHQDNSISSDRLANWLTHSILTIRFIRANMARLIDENLLEAIFPTVGNKVSAHYIAFESVLAKIENKGWRVEQYWSSNPDYRFEVCIPHLVYAHMIICALDINDNNIKKSLIAIINSNEIFKKTFPSYNEPALYLNLFKRAFENIHGDNVLNPFMILDHNERKTRLNLRLFGGSPTNSSVVASNQDWRANTHGKKAFTP